MLRTRFVLAAWLTASPAFAAVVINEIHYNPDPGADTLYEFFELLNTGAAAVDVGGWSMGAGVVHTFAAGTLIPAGGFLVVAKNAATIEDDFGLSGVVQWTSGDLNNGGETLTLLNESAGVVDTVPYDDGGCWTTAPDGNGPSLELISPLLDNSLCGSWAASLVDYGTPGATNSVYEAPGGPPVISGLTQNPVAPSYADAVTVGATITDEGAVVLAQLEWTLNGGASQFLPMTPQGGDLYQGVIPAQAAGAVVAWRVTATDDDANTTLGDWRGYAVAGGTVDVVINELHYNGPEAGTDLTEFIELYNNGTATVALDGWSFSGVTFTFPAGVSLVPGDYLVVAVSAAGFMNFFGFAPDFTWSSGALSNDGEAIVLSNAQAQQMDRVAYDDAAPWPTTPDGGGPSLELVDPDLDNLLAASWQASLVPGGTPGARNSVAMVDARERPGRVALGTPWPNPFNPVAHVPFQVAETGQVRLAVFDLAGREVAVLWDGMAAPGAHEARFDASRLASGLYVARLTGGGVDLAVPLTLVK